MKVSPELAKQMIRAQGFRRVQAFSPDRSELIFRAEGSADALCDAVDEVVAMVAGTFRLEADNPRERVGGRERAGRPSEASRPMVVLVSGGYGAPGPVASVDDRLAKIEALLSTRTDDEEEEEEEEEAPTADPMAEALVARLVGILERLVPSPPAAPIAGPPPVAGPPPPMAAMSADEARTIAAALNRLRSEDPQAYTMYRSALLAQYGPKN